ncbi:hypothetical protein F4779DRAFT_395108 [Xylariaceae sp. FL0662B]|nr:hypothetical protein F4779DRAFT_395108 [Xylariaceae sp. FL0662B]
MDFSCPADPSQPIPLPPPNDAMTHPGEFPMLPSMQAYAALNSLLAAAAVISVVLRVVGRKLTKAGLGYDDAMIMAALPQGIAMLAMQIVFSKIGIGYPIKEVYANGALMQKLVVAMDVIGAACLATIKLSVLWFYLRVFDNAQFRKAIAATTIVVILWTSGNIMEPFLVCRPFDYTWDPTIRGGTCGSKKAVSISIGMFSVITDIIIIALPIPAIWKLGIDRKRKWAATSLFLIGLSVTIAAIVRIIYLIKTDVKDDFTSTGGAAIFLSVFEIQLSILCVSLPMIRPLVKRYRGRCKFTWLKMMRGRIWRLSSARSSPTANRDVELANLGAASK